jgi:hypothetical protein|tara:strand:- start:46 stop:384 length:339 start_codon:yes stop_codon:yes gene_type:complete
MSNFTSTYNKGFNMTFENGFNISVQWGVNNYCSKRNDGAFDESMKGEFWDSTTAEVAIFNHNTTPRTILNIDYTSGGVVGWLDADSVAKLITIVSSATSIEEIELKCKSLNL